MNYSTPVFRPPSEAYSFIVQLTHGCPYNTCRFCGMYKSKQFKVEKLENIITQLKEIPVFRRKMVKRIFLGDGDPMVTGFSVINELLIFLNKFFPELQRVSAYATAQSINCLNVEEIKELKNNKLKLFYMGLESGYDKLLDFCDKKGNSSEFINACNLIREAGAKSSVTAILGLGGKDFSNKHAFYTAEVINKAKPKFFSLLTLIYGGNEEFINDIKLLTKKEIMIEMRTIIKNLNINTIFRSNHVSNICDVNGTLLKDKEKMIERIDSFLDKYSLNSDLNSVPQFNGENSY
ncbi:MAG: radical SAM protein [Candidatus Muiribacteriota bacterium]